MKTEKISGFQLFTLLTLSVLSTALLITPAQSAGKDAWMAVLIAIPYNLILIFFIHRFYMASPDKSIVDILVKTPIIKYPIAIIFIFFLTVLNALTIRDAIEVFASFALPETPIVVTTGLLVALCVITAKLGLEVIARVSEWSLPLIGVSILFISTGIVKDIDLINLQPVLEEGLGPVFLASLSPFDFIGFIFIAVFLNPYIDKPQVAARNLVISVILSSIVLSTQALVVFTILGENLALNHPFSMLQVARYGQLDFLIGLEAPILTLWLSLAIIKISLILWVLAELISKTLALKIRNQLITPFAILCIALSLAMFPNSVVFGSFGTSPAGPGIFPYFAITVQFFLTVFVILLVQVINRQKKSPQSGFPGKKKGE